MRATALAAVIATALLAGCGGDKTTTSPHVGTWVLDRDGADRRVSAAELDLRSDRSYRLTITVDGKPQLLENQWSVEGGVILLRFAAENTGEQKRINAHGAEIQAPDRLQLLYRVAVGEVVRATLVRKPAAGP